MFQPYKTELIAKTDYNWRVKFKISGGGLFFDLAPHQLDILIWMLGDPVSYCGNAVNQARLYEAVDTVCRNHATTGQCAVQRQLVLYHA